MSTTPFIPTGDLHPVQWHQERALGVGGSEAASMFNEGWGCNRRLIMEKRGMEPDYRRTEAEEKTLRRGNKLEDIVAAEFVSETELKVRKQPARVSKSHPHARVNLDRQIIAVDGQTLYHLTKDEHGFSPLADILANPGPGALECKTMNSFDFKKLSKERTLDKHNHYILQLQHAMAVTGYRWGMFAILDTTSFELIWFAMLRNDALCAEILARVEASWELVTDTTLPLPAPLPDGDKRCARCLHRRTCRGDAYLTKYAGADFATDYRDSADPEIVQWATDLEEAEVAADQANTIVDTIKGLIKTRMEAESIAKLRIPNIRRFSLTVSAGRKGWDGTALDGEINALRKGELSVKDEEAQAALESSPELVKIILPALAERIENCKKLGKPSTTFRLYNA